MTAELQQIPVDLDWLCTRDSEPLVSPRWPSSSLQTMIVVEEMGDPRGTPTYRALHVPTKELAEAVGEHVTNGTRQLWFTVLASSVRSHFGINF